MDDTTAASLVIFGATGDLTRRKLIPSLYGLYRDGHLPKHIKIFAFARRPFTHDAFVATLTEFIKQTDRWPDFAERIEYVQGDFNDQKAYELLKQRLEQFESPFAQCPLRVYYMATSPEELPHIVRQVGQANLHTGCGESGRWTRIVIEKPFGYDLDSAQELNRQISAYFKEEQIYRIDHYLGKETVQNILSTRFANIILEPVWCSEYIEKIEIVARETLGVEQRGGYYDRIGALRDMVQSHLLQILALVLMDQPARFDADEIRDKKNEVLRALRPLTPARIALDSVRGQYIAIPHSDQKSYKEENKVAIESATETFVALRTFVDLPQWRDVPIYISTGKRLNERKTFVRITFRRSKGTVFSNLFCELRSNTLTIQLQPDEGVNLKMLIKKPGFSTELADAFLDYKYSDTFESLPDAYERLLLDTLHGDQSLFARTDEIESSWRYISEIKRLWESEQVPISEYLIGSEGPPLQKF